MQSFPMKTLRYLRAWLAVGWALVGLVVILSIIPSPSESQAFEGADKVAHLAAYAGIMLWFGAIYSKGRPHAFFAAVFTLLGAVLEIAQGFTATRSPDWFDLLANATGVAIGWSLAQTRLARVFIMLESHLSRGSRI